LRRDDVKAAKLGSAFSGHEKEVGSAKKNISIAFHSAGENSPAVQNFGT
jgi:hypothetical protein